MKRQFSICVDGHPATSARTDNPELAEILSTELARRFPNTQIDTYELIGNAWEQVNATCIMRQEGE